jgi:hypothetical protein
LIASAHEKCIGADENGIDTLLDEVREGRVDIVFAARIQDLELKPKRVRRSPHVSSL